ncbi:transcriptional regulator, partial [Candidatus Saccharibacteria bacterium]|nr:transcriptional regulator [Calditrichia bacterium]NIV72084.1 transcriptional regulator [Calditrichia bacterium]NIV99165.1 transcriptional regulator [Candidatus Saccharibacteria bacterium]NIW80925.1 transcriptional regulator [Calditrichia bacterium]
MCPACQSRNFENVTLQRQGKLVTYTIIRVPPSQFADQAPYAMGIVEVVDGVRLMTQLVDCDPEKIEMG